MLTLAVEQWIGNAAAVHTQTPLRQRAVSHHRRAAAKVYQRLKILYELYPRDEDHQDKKSQAHASKHRSFT